MAETENCINLVIQVALVVKNPPASAGDVRDMGLILGLGRSPGGGTGLGNSMNRGAWRAIVHAATELDETEQYTKICMKL